MKRLSLFAVMLASALQPAVSVAGLILNVDSDAYAEGTDIRNGYAGITLTILDETSTAVFARSGYSGFVKRNIAITGTLGFGQPLGPGTAEFDNEKLFDEVNFGLLRADSASFVSFVSIDLLFDDDDIGLLRAFDS